MAPLFWDGTPAAGDETPERRGADARRPNSLRVAEGFDRRD
jgi:hypothetical protein